MEEELTAKMHSEFVIPQELEDKNTAIVIWNHHGLEAPEDELRNICDEFGFSFEILMKYKELYRRLVKEGK